MVWVRHHLERNAMGTSNAFVTKFAASIVAVLSCFDRVIFKGHLPFGGDQHLNRFVDHVLKMRRKDFLPFLEGQSAQLVAHAQALAEQHGAPYVYLQGRHRKEEVVRQTIHERRLDEGLVCVLCCQEPCRTVKLLHGRGRPRLAFTWKPQRVLYFYWLDPDFGLRRLRVQNWFPFLCAALPGRAEELFQEGPQGEAGGGMLPEESRRPVGVERPQGRA